MWGGVFGLTYVENERWGGLTLTLLLSTFGIALAFPLSILLALGRRSDLPLVRWLSIGYIELIRGVPLISVLFMASVMLPLFLPQGVSIDKLLRAQLAMILFAAAYLAEVIRGGLQAIPRSRKKPPSRSALATGSASVTSPCRKPCASPYRPWSIPLSVFSKTHRWSSSSACSTFSPRSKSP